MPSSLAQLVRDKLNARKLPVEAPVKVFIGPGSGMPCSVCDKTILPSQVEYEPDYELRLTRVRFHIGCHGRWEAERRRRGYTLETSETIRRK